jgi:NADH-quinone oxidoreductase subunit N
VSFSALVQSVLHDTLGPSLWAFRPELVLCAFIVLMLLVRMIVPAWKTGAFYIMLAGTAVALLEILSQTVDGTFSLPRQSFFTGMLVCDGFSVFMRGVLLVFALLFTTFTQVAGIPDAEDAAEFYILVLGALIGMCLMVSANHMLIVFLGIEMASVPSYMLAGILKHQRAGSEAALKYAVFGAGTAGVMLFGISLLMGVLGSAHLPTMAVRLAELNLSGLGGDRSVVLVLGGLMLMVGLAFKLSAVPFHFWAPDVFEGAPAEVGAFLSIASKAAALGLLVRLAMGFSYIEPSAPGAYHPCAAVTNETPQGEEVQARRGHEALGISGQDTAMGNLLLSPTLPRSEVNTFDAPLSFSAPQSSVLNTALAPARRYIALLLSLLAAITCTFGNLAAYGQTNMKRLLAYSTIAHAGYLMMPVAAAVALLGSDPAGTRDAIAAMAFYIGIYLFMNFGAFAVVAFLRNATGSEQIADYAGLIRRSPGVAVCAAIILFSLIGLPPLAGFAAKFAIFAALFNARMLALLAIGGLNTVLSLFYYLRVVRAMTLEPEAAGRPAPEIPVLSVPGAYCVMLTAPLIILFVWWQGLFQWAQAAAASLL